MWNGGRRELVENLMGKMVAFLPLLRLPCICSPRSARTMWVGSDVAREASLINGMTFILSFIYFSSICCRAPRGVGTIFDGNADRRAGRDREQTKK